MACSSKDLSVTKFCGCVNCIKLQGLFQNIKGLQSFVKQLKFAFSGNLPSNIQNEINAFVNSKWNWQVDVNRCEGLKDCDINIPVKVQENPGTSLIEMHDESDNEDECILTQKMVLKCVSALLEPESRGDKEIIAAVSAKSDLLGTPISLQQPRFTLQKNRIVVAKNTKWNRCSVCELSFKTSELLKVHMESHKAIQQCSKDHEGFNTFIRSETSKYIRPYIIPSDSDNVDREIVKCAIGDLLHKCKHCDTYFIGRKELEDHEKTCIFDKGPNSVNCGYAPKKTYCCGLCDKMFNEASGLQSHIVLQHKEAYDACKICGKAYETLRDLGRHLFYKHAGRNPEVDKPDHDCPLCGKTFFTSYYMKLHFKTH